MCGTDLDNENLKAAGEIALACAVSKAWVRIVEQDAWCKSGRKFHAAAHSVENSGMSLRGRAAGINENDSSCIATRDGLICTTKAVEKCTIFLLETILIFVSGCLVGGLGALFGLGLVAAAGALDASSEVEVEQDGEIGLQVAAENSVQGKNRFRSEFAAAALVGLSGVGEAVA